MPGPAFVGQALRGGRGTTPEGYMTEEEWAASEGYTYPWPQGPQTTAMHALYLRYVQDWLAANQEPEEPEVPEEPEIPEIPEVPEEPAEPGVPITPQLPEEAFGYGTGQEFAQWLQRLQGGGMMGYSPAQRWARQQYQPTYQSYELANQLRGLMGQQETQWGQAPFRSTLDPNLWGQVQGLGTGQEAQDWIGQMGGSEGFPLWSMAAASSGGGRVTPYTRWLQQQAAPQYWNWQAFGQPGVQGTTGQSWMDWINQYMGQ